MNFRARHSCSLRSSTKQAANIRVSDFAKDESTRHMLDRVGSLRRARLGQRDQFIGCQAEDPAELEECLELRPGLVALQFRNDGRGNPGTSRHSANGQVVSLPQLAEEGKIIHRSLCVRTVPRHDFRLRYLGSIFILSEKSGQGRIPWIASSRSVSCLSLSSIRRNTLRRWAWPRRQAQPHPKHLVQRAHNSVAMPVPLVNDVLLFTR